MPRISKLKARWYNIRHNKTGVEVCERWQKFSNFEQDVGQAPEGKMLARIDLDKGFSPENVRWVLLNEKGKKFKKHGACRTPDYLRWCNMHSRCRDRNRPDFHRYGGRGISVAPEWDTFEQFILDMGPCPPGMSIDRIDNDQGYCRTNCRYVDRQEQAENRSYVQWLEFRGERMTIQAFCRKFKISRKALSHRLSFGLTLEQAILIKRGQLNYKKPKKYPDELIREIQEHVRLGMTQKVAAAKFGISETTLARRLTAIGFQR